MKKGIMLSIAASTIVMAAGYKIPEQSVNSTALSAAYIAHTMGADTAYYNPAAMSFMDDKYYLEGGMTLANLPSIEFTSDVSTAYNGKSKVENIPIPYGYFVSKPYGDWRWGVSLTAPGGLSKRWDTAVQKASAEEFTLRVVELSPSFSYKLSDNFSLGGGVRLVYSDGVVKSTYTVSRDMEGDTLAAGYNLAMLYKAPSDINLAATYRSKVNLNEKGNAKLYSGATLVYNGGASVEIPLPATLTIGASKTWNDKLTVEFDWERAYWSAYKELDFEYDSAIPAPLVPYFDNPVAKNWKDSDTYRLGVTYKMDDALTLMGGYAKGDSPVPNNTIGFELPDSDATYYSAGFKYKQNENLSWGAALLYADKDSLHIPAGSGNPNGAINAGGTFDKGGAILATVGASYEF
jgi:long-chain fatty acid transport protein